MLLEESLADIMVKVATELYQKCVIISSKDKPLLYVQIKKLLYGLLHSALLLHRNLVRGLDAYGFQINPYDPFVKKNMINDKQMTLVWNVEDLKFSHSDSSEVTKFAGYMSSIYGGLILQRWKVHDFLAIGLDYR